ncbi:MAG: 4Fe-4S dicluster domain-containing protein [Alphaproteobacteria bacterium]|nr:4Fe-4S dicluster domain-containing protein [Alphaproteobacteria bacterium]
MNKNADNSPAVAPPGWPSNREPLDGAGLGPQASDAAAGIEVTAEFERLSQKNDMFCRSRWDPDVRNEAAKRFFQSHHVIRPRKGDGFRQRDLAFRNAAWSVANEYSERGFADGRAEGFLDEIQAYSQPADIQAEIVSPAAQAAEIKRVARLFGADLAGVTGYDERWVYSEKFDFKNGGGRPNEATEGMTNVIVLAHAMDRELIATMPSALAGAAVGNGYSKEITTAQQVAEYIRNLGYRAVASANDTALAIPYAIKAGLGEYGRNQMVITRDFGPRVRFSKIFTDLPLAYDEPVSFGVRKFCDMCERCAQACPPKALPFGPPTDAGPNKSSIRGVKKWTADCEKCFGYWVKMSTDCAICMRVCPYNKDFTRGAWRLWRRIAGTRLRKLALWFDDRLGAGQRRAPKHWWEKAQGGNA